LTASGYTADRIDDATSDCKKAITAVVTGFTLLCIYPATSTGLESMFTMLRTALLYVCSACAKDPKADTFGALELAHLLQYS
jgi:hypothetical protein